ncbi:NAD(P)H-dependent flavin oxidoreductase YrpB (nitropropane dioxygenase family) [Nocardiopsis mwathae]|uniref:NAD(P)H-dependent flavin oxidoreductase YrpB (Nitropropane dioxygenase family) n=1 Tax=Nocardiopsis mwathae TaxID=1472723 RepID=A0A7X0D6N3_9ACTN|nr:nitronate monooxygenase [Nocardiopsis mwathae]MBB6172294.1 NAD(P)H-dependent flavin oxidoreductase YrpB (nitropropane dioxygenase family) [Nocardiopsis mwathae]
MAPVAEPSDLPALIQGGMGVGVSGWRLARAVARTGQLGVVSGVALDVQLARRLWLGDPDGHLRRALAHFPDTEAAERILRRYYVPGGVAADRRRFRPVPRPSLRPNRTRTDLTVAGNFAEVWLAKEGHGGLVGVNYLEKIQLATPAAVYGAMLAGVDYVLMGAGIPTEIPALLDALAARSPVELTVDVAGTDERHTVAFDPSAFPEVGPLPRPRFLAIVSSDVLAMYLNRSSVTRPDGFVVEAPSAGGHSAPPRGRMRLDASGEPVYGPRDRVDLAKVAVLGLPFWTAGGYASPRGMAAAGAAGAAGIQVGSAFALCRESGLDPRLRRRLLQRVAEGTLAVRNDPLASPAGFPFKVAEVPGTLSEDDVYEGRPRLCDLGYLRTPYARPDGGVGYRCPAEPVDEYLAKGGAAEDTVGRQCLCNGLVAGVGLGRHRPGGYVEPPLLTLGQDLGFLPDLLGADGDYSASDVVRYLLPE